MHERLLLDPDALRRAAVRFAGAGDDLDAAARRLRDGLAALGDVYGDDEAGLAFAADLVPARRRAEAAVANLSACARGAARGLATMAEAVIAADAASAVPGPNGPGRS